MQKLRFEIGVNYNLSKLQGEKVLQIPNDHIFLQVMPSSQSDFALKQWQFVSYPRNRKAWRSKNETVWMPLCVQQQEVGESPLWWRRLKRSSRSGRRGGPCSRPYESSLSQSMTPPTPTGSSRPWSSMLPVFFLGLLACFLLILCWSFVQINFVMLFGSSCLDVCILLYKTWNVYFSNINYLICCVRSQYFCV